MEADLRSLAQLDSLTLYVTRAAGMQRVADCEVCERIPWNLPGFTLFTETAACRTPPAAAGRMAAVAATTPGFASRALLTGGFCFKKPAAAAAASTRFCFFF
jgi:hypothetical protein